MLIWPNQLYGLTMVAYNKSQVKEFSNTIKLEHPEIWEILVKRESADAIYTYEEEMQIFSFIRDKFPGVNTIDSINLFLGVRQFVNFSIGLHDYGEEF